MLQIFMKPLNKPQATGDHSTWTISNTLSSIVPTWQPWELVRWGRQQHSLPVHSF